MLFQTFGEAFNLLFFMKSFCGGPGGGFFKKRPLAVGDKKEFF